jgi:hypothetical protein
MKTICKTTAIVILVLFCTNILKAQSSQTKIDQVEFIKQFIGIWKAEIGKDTLMVFNIRPFGNASERDFTISSKGKILNSGKMLFGYDEVNDKIIEALLYKSSPNMIINVWWATSKTTSEGVPLKDISKPEKATFKMKSELKSPDVFTMTHIRNNKVVAEYTFTREKIDK